MSNRRFGVEIECGFGPLRGEAADRVRKALKQNKIPFLSVGCDGSGVEVRTRVLQGKEGIQELKTVMDFLKSFGCFVSSADGMHVHHEANEFVGNLDLQALLVESWHLNKHIINSFVATRRSTSSWCSPWALTDIKRLKEKKKVYSTRGALNIAGIQNRTSKNTIEIRLHHGTLDSDKAIAWVLFGQRFIDNVASRKRRPMLPAKDQKEFLQRLRVRQEIQKQLIERRAA